MFDFIQNIWLDLHPILVHFAVAGLFLSFALTLLARFRPNAALNEASWILLVVGVLAAVPSVVTGLVAHLPYEETEMASVIEPHQFLALIGTVVMIGVVFWRWRARRQGKDLHTNTIYLGIVILGLVWIFLVGGTGGNLVYELAINVRGVNPLLK